MNMNKKQFNEPYSHVKVQKYGSSHDSHRMQITPLSSMSKGSELTRKEIDNLYWKLLAPLNYKVLEGRYFLVCPVCDVDLGHAKDYLHSKDDFKVEVHYGTKARSKHDAECKATPEA
jgi:hypothetical protein